MIITHMSVYLGLLSIIIISHIIYASIVIIIDVCLVIFHNGALIVLCSNTIDDNSISPSLCLCAAPSHNRVMIVSGQFVVSHLCW